MASQLGRLAADVVGMRRSVAMIARSLLLTGCIGGLVISCGTGHETSGQSTEAAGKLCDPGPDASVVSDDTIDRDRRGEALVEHLTGIDEMKLQSEQEGIDIIYDDPNYGGVWGDFAGGWVVAVLDCSKVDADRIAEIAGGTDSVRLIEVRYAFEEVNDFRDRLVSELQDSDVAGDVFIDSTLTGRHIRVIVRTPDKLDADFGSTIPADAFFVDSGQLMQPN